MKDRQTILLFLLLQCAINVYDIHDLSLPHYHVF